MVQRIEEQYISNISMRMETASSSSSSSGEITIECNGSSSECQESAETLSFTSDESLPDYGLPEMVVFLQDVKYMDDMDTDVQSEDKFSLEIQDFDPEFVAVIRHSDLGIINDQSGRSTCCVHHHYNNEKKDQVAEDVAMANSAAPSVAEKIIKANGKCLTTTACHRATMVIGGNVDGLNCKCHKAGRRVCTLRELMLENRESSTKSDDDTSCVHPTACIGSNVCPRSISIQSNCSTSSYQSFAFPVLPRMWIGSPVRMAKADRNQMWKHQGWRRYFRCFIV